MVSIANITTKSGHCFICSTFLGPGCGIVVAVGPDVSQLKVGQPVACNSVGFGEYGVAEEGLCTPVDRLTPETVVLQLSGVCANAMLLKEGGASKGSSFQIIDVYSHSLSAAG